MEDNTEYWALAYADNIIIILGWSDSQGVKTDINDLIIDGRHHHISLR